MDNKKKTVKVDTQNCIWCGACIAICSNVFKFNKDNKSVAVNQPKDKEEWNNSIQAEAACPVSVIHIDEE